MLPAGDDARWLGEPARGETFELRWFTPSVEVDLCGHATLAAAHALFSAPGGRESPLLRFGTRSGELVAALRGEGGRGRVGSSVLPSA